MTNYRDFIDLNENAIDFLCSASWAPGHGEKQLNIRSTNESSIKFTCPNARLNRLLASIAILALATISIHLDEVQCTVESTSNVGIIDCVRELLVLQLEKIVCVVIFHQICARANILAVRSLCDETKLQLVPGRLDTIGVGVLLVSALDHALLLP